MFSERLEKKLSPLRQKKEAIKLGQVEFSSPLILAPMAAICNWPFRLLMEELGAGGTVSELISCHGIEYRNQKTLDMLKIHPREKHVGIQLFGEDAESINKAAEFALEFGPKFLDLNMGCPVRKVVNKGGGSALLKDEKKLGLFFETMKKNIPIPFSIKIRTGWDHDNLNADKVIAIAEDTGIEFVAIHGRTRNQQYTGLADWDYLEKLALTGGVPIIGNGDLHSSYQVRDRLNETNCDALMIARGALRDPFIFLSSFSQQSNNDFYFDGLDYWEVLSRYYEYIKEGFERPHVQLVQFRKLAVWFSAGFPNASHYRSLAFSHQDINDVMKYSEDYFLSLENKRKMIDYNQSFMTSGHG
jgi:nifR3 family TIM-barrel protein